MRYLLELGLCLRHFGCVCVCVCVCGGGGFFGGFGFFLLFCGGLGLLDVVEV